MPYAILLLLFTSLNVFAGNNLGQEMVTIPKPNGAVATVTIFDEPEAYRWNLTFNVLSQNIATYGQISTMSWRAYNMRTNVFLNDWTKISPLTTCPAGCTLTFSVTANGRADVEALYSQMNHLAIVFSVNSATLNPTHFISVEKLCRTNPDAVFNETSLETGCP